MTFMLMDIGMALHPRDLPPRVAMVDISAKPETARVAIARGQVIMNPKTMALILAGEVPKGNVLAVARLAGIMSAKRASELLPLCHPVPLSVVEVDIQCDGELGRAVITATCKAHSRTGVEMEALTAVSVAALTIYDMCKALDRVMQLAEVKLLYKSGGQGGTFGAIP